MTEANIGHRLAQAASCPPPPDLHIVGEGEVHHLISFWNTSNKCLQIENRNMTYDIMKNIFFD